MPVVNELVVPPFNTKIWKTWRAQQLMAFHTTHLLTDNKHDADDGAFSVSEYHISFCRLLKLLLHL
jgi:hypothetical protein